MNVGWAANAGAGRGCFVRGNVINNMVEDGDNDTKDGVKSRHLTTHNTNDIGNWMITINLFSTNKSDYDRKRFKLNTSDFLTCKVES